MRSIGTLTKWNDDRGFGFITPNQAGDEIFVHISAFPRDGVRQTIGEVISFEHTVSEGKIRAVKVQRALVKGTKTTSVKTTKTPFKYRDAESIGWLRVIPLAAMIIMGYFIYDQYDQRQSTKAELMEKQRPRSDEEIRNAIRQSLNGSDAGIPPPRTVVESSSTAVGSAFRCDGRLYCSQMTSCEEAKFFLNNCPGVKMDGGDGQGAPDGVPCEAQWCPD